MKSPDELTIPVQAGASTTALVYRARESTAAAFLLAHGAGAPQRSPWIVNLAVRLADRGQDVITFNFLYTQLHRKLPDRQPVLEDCYRAVIQGVRERVESARRALFIGGKSMGGRIATHVAAADAELPVAGLILLGYPLHPPGRPDRRRDAHLPSVRRPMLFIQGSRDAFGTQQELEPVVRALTPRATLHVIEGGDHSLKVTGRDPARQAAVFEDVDTAIVEWIGARSSVHPDDVRRSTHLARRDPGPDVPE